MVLHQKAFMADGRRPSRTHKAINYAKLDVGSDDEDEDFQPVGVGTKKQRKVREKENVPAKEKRAPPVGDIAAEVAAPKPKRPSLEEKLLDRDLKIALRLSQRENVPLDDRTRDGGAPEVQVLDQQVITLDEDIAAAVEIGTTTASVADASGTAREDVEHGAGGSCKRDVWEARPSERRGGSAGEESTSRCSGEPSPEPAWKEASKPEGGRLKNAGGRSEPSTAAGKARPNGRKIAAARPHEGSSTSASVPKPKATVPKPVERRSTNGSPSTSRTPLRPPSSGIRLGLSRKHVGKPLHSVVKVGM